MQLGINLTVLGPGEPMAMYHWEADQEDFLVLSGEALLVIEGRGAQASTMGLRALPSGDEPHDRRRVERHRVSCSPSARGIAPAGPDWGAYTVDEAALRRGAGVERETTESREAYARFPRSVLTRYRDGWLAE